jgi:hypothetical protein
MNSQTSPATQQSLIGMDTRLPGCWQLGHGRAVSLLPREAGVLRIAHGRVWATLDELTGDHVLHTGEQLVLKPGQRVVMESMSPAGETSAYFNWEPVSAAQAGALGAREPWQQALAQPWLDLRLALALGARALGGLALGLARVALARLGLGGASRRLSAQSSAARAQGAIA